MSSENNNQNEGTINLGEIFRVLWKNIILIVIVAAVFFAGGCVYSYSIVEETYVSRSTVVVAINASSSSTSSDKLDTTTTARLLNTIIDLVKEDIVLSTVAQKHNLSTSALSSMTSVSNMSGSNLPSLLVRISVETSDRKLSKDLANEITAQLIEVANTNDAFSFIKGAITQTSEAKDGVYASPNKAVYLLVSIVAGAVVGCLVVFIKEFMSSKFKTRKDVEGILDERIIGYFVNDKKKEREEIKRKGEKIHRLPELLEPGTRTYLPYNNLFTNIKYADLERPYQVIMVTSSKEGELKSTIITNLAACIAHNDQRTLIIDMDMRKSVVHKVFKVSKERGLLEYIEGECTEEEIIKHTESGVDIITAGKSIPNPIVVIENSKIAKLIDSLRARYDYILVDAPPVLACSDAVSIGKLCDGVIFNVSMNDVKKKEAKGALESLKMVGTRIVGVNVTKGVDYDRESGYYYYYNNYREYAEKADSVQSGALVSDSEEALREAAVADADQKTE